MNNLIKNSLILSLPGILSILISLTSIPVHLNIAGAENYANYIIFHFFLFFTNLLNFGIGKSVVISINNFQSKNKEISYQGIKYTFIVFLFIFLISLIYFFISQNYNYHLIILNVDLIFIILGTMCTIWFLTFEGIFQGNEKYKSLSLYNFLFYSLSLALPSLLLLFNETLISNDLIKISILIKFITILLMLANLHINKLIIKSSNKILLENLKKNSKWISLNVVLIQFYDIFDKYVIKFFLGPIALVNYSIPQQLTGKLSIISKGFSAFLLPKLSKKEKRNDDFSLSIDIFLKYISFLIFILFPFYDYLLTFWLGNQSNDKIVFLSKIFSISVIYACVSHILITKFEASKKLKKNIKIEILILPFFLISLIYLNANNFSLIATCSLILVKEYILLTVRFFILRKNLKKIKFYYFSTLIFIPILYLSVSDNKLYYLSIILLFIYNFKYKNA